jgi:Fur family transcriptional regulator, ferric uptake regulator
VENQEIKRAGLKVTTPRVKILKVLEECGDRHVSAEDVYRVLMQRQDDIGLATIYRVLTQFEGAGLVRRHNFEGGSSVFELERGGHHDHIVCLDCGKVKEFCDDAIERLQREIAEAQGFEIERHSLIIYGRCKDPSCPFRNGDE